MLILDPLDRVPVFARVQPLPLLVELAVQVRVQPRVRHGQGDDDGVVDGQQHEDEHRRPREGAFFREEGPLRAAGEGVRAAQAEAREDREEECRDRGGAGDGDGEAVDAVQGDAFCSRMFD